MERSESGLTERDFPQYSALYGLNGYTLGYTRRCLDDCCDKACQTSHGYSDRTGREGLLAFPPRTSPRPATGKRRRLDKSDRIKSKARAKFEDALAKYQGTEKIKTGKSSLLRDWFGRWLDEYKRPMVKPLVYETYRSDCRNITAVIGSVRLEDFEPWHVKEMSNKIMQDWIRDHGIGDGDLVFTRREWPLTQWSGGAGLQRSKRPVCRM